MTDAHDPTDAEAGLNRAGLRVPFAGGGKSDASAGLAPSARGRLVRLLVAKAAADLLLVCALAAGFYYTSFRHTLRGALEHADARSVRGWVSDESRPDRRVEVQLYLDGRFVATTVADQPLAGADARDSAGDGRRGFVFRLDPLPAGEHEARVYALHAPADGRRHTLQQLGRPVRFVSEAGGGRR